MCVEELARNQSVRKIASTFGVDESTLKYRLGSVLFPQGFKHDLGLEFRVVTLSYDGYWSLPISASAKAMISP